MFIYRQKIAEIIKITTFKSSGTQTLCGILDDPRPFLFCFVIRGVTIRFNNDSIRITIRGCRYDTRTILVHLERYDPKRFSDLKSIQ